MAKFTLSSLDVCGGVSVDVSVGPQILSPEISCRLTIAFASSPQKQGSQGYFWWLALVNAWYSWISRMEKHAQTRQVCVRLADCVLRSQWYSLIVSTYLCDGISAPASHGDTDYHV